MVTSDKFLCYIFLGHDSLDPTPSPLTTLTLATLPPATMSVTSPPFGHTFFYPQLPRPHLLWPYFPWPHLSWPQFPWLQFPFDPLPLVSCSHGHNFLDHDLPLTTPFFLVTPSTATAGSLLFSKNGSPFHQVLCTR